MASVSVKLLDTEMNADVHFLPCSINYNGPALIDSYFKIAVDSKGSKSACLRGHQLIGKRVTLNEDVVGLVLDKTNSNKSYEIRNKFDSLTVWEHDVPPEESLMSSDINDWIAISKAVCNYYFQLK